MMSQIVVRREICSELKRNRYVSIRAEELSIDQELMSDFRKFSEDWDSLELDNYLRKSAKFRFRRFNYMYFLPSTGELLQFPPRLYVQSSDINSYIGDVRRKFAPISVETSKNRFLQELIRFNFKQFPDCEAKIDTPWMIDIHQIRIVGTLDEIGEPTPEGPHHDENDFGCIHLIGRKNVDGGVNTIYDNDGVEIESLTLRKAMDSMIICDPDVMHGVSPILPEEPNMNAVRDVLLMGFSHMPNLEKPSWPSQEANGASVQSKVALAEN